MTVTIHFQSSDDYKILEPLITLLNKADLKVHLQSDPPTTELRKKAQQFLQFLEVSSLRTIDKIIIPNREDRNAR